MSGWKKMYHLNVMELEIQYMMRLKITKNVIMGTKVVLYITVCLYMSDAIRSTKLDYTTEVN